MASVYPLFKLMSAPDTAATVLFDFNSEDGNTTAPQRIRVEDEGFSVSTPELQGDPDSVFPQYGPRTVSLSLQIWGPKTYALGKVSAASRWLLRDNCWLMVQLDAAMSPRWFKLYRPDPGDLVFGYVRKGSKGDVWRWDVKLPAEAFAYGAKVTMSPITINNDPASGTNPCSYILPTILGDAPAPLTVDITPSVSWAECQPLMALAAHDAGTSPTLQVWQTGGFTAGTDTTAATADAAYSGGSRSTVTFATNTTLVTRLSSLAPSTPPAGRYKVLCRMARSDTSTTFAVRFGQNFGLSDTRWGDTKRMVRSTSATSGFACYMDLGDFTFPIGSDGLTAAEIGTAPTPDIQLQVQRLSGSGSVYVDAFVLIPLSVVTQFSSGQTRTMISRFYNSDISSNRNGIWDADKQIFRAMSFGISMYGGGAPWLRGQFLSVLPGLVNMFHLQQQIDGDDPFFLPGTTDNKDILTGTESVIFSYYPRWLYIGDGS